ncbi:hypothetical protein K8374_14450 [Pseudomonas sp. p1(2021b)]|uniref:hypothetical protein n=1 Tax=Pseudomonas sp. p1(2021b) TaxID=2874628 RepID=UPI001CCC8A76|nr:hypothetical protein [Pseudomonas sp. p1(2021b)]UBM23596.1 hypothetical protein K8374_14450 [Pseudomonas sp. p1(2021b)]
MSWEKVGKALVGVLVVATSVAALYALLKDDAGLEARLTYAYLTYPSQFSERISTTNDLLKYERLHEQVSAIGKGALSHQQVDKLVELAQAPYLQLFAKPFEAGLVDHRTGLLIELRNKGQTPLRKVQIRLPAKGLVQIRDDAGNDTIVQAPTSVIEIDAIRREGASKVWVYFDSDYSLIRQGGISIRHDGGAADVQIYREFVGFPAWAGRYGRELVAALAVLVVVVLGLGAVCFRQRRRACGDGLARR